MDKPPNKPLYDMAVRQVTDAQKERKKKWEESRVGDLVKINRASIGVPMGSFGVIKEKKHTDWGFPGTYVIHFVNGKQCTLLGSELTNVSRQERKKYKTLHERLESNKQQ